MLSAKIYITDGSLSKFHSDFPITSELHGRLLISVDSGLNYTDVDSNLWYVENDDFIFYNEDNKPTNGVYVKILVATNPDELYTVEVDSQLTALQDLVTDSETIANNVAQNVLDIEGINEDIENTYTIVNGIKEQVDQDVIDTTNFYNLCNNLVNISNQQIIDLNLKISQIDVEKIEANDLVDEYQALLATYDTNVTLINNKLVELEAYKTSIEANASLTTSAAEDAENAKDLALQYRDESIAVVDGADVNITEIEQLVDTAQDLETSASGYVSEATTAAGIAETAEANVVGLVAPTETARDESISAANEANLSLINSQSLLDNAQNIATGNIIDDDNSSTNMVYSSSKIETEIENIPDRFIRDNLPSSLTTTYSASKIENTFENLKFSNLVNYYIPNLTDFIHIYNSNLDNYYKVPISGLNTLFTNSNYEFNNLDELNNITANDYMYIYDGDTNAYKKILASNVLDYSNTSTLYDFISNERFIGQDNNGDDIYRVSITITEGTPLSDNYFTQQTLYTNKILNLDCIVKNTTTDSSESLKIKASSVGNGDYLLETTFTNTGLYNQILIYIDLIK